MTEPWDKHDDQDCTRLHSEHVAHDGADNWLQSEREGDFERTKVADDEVEDRMPEDAWPRGQVHDPTEIPGAEEPAERAVGVVDSDAGDYEEEGANKGDWEGVDHLGTWRRQESDVRCQ